MDRFGARSTRQADIAQQGEFAPDQPEPIRVEGGQKTQRQTKRIGDEGRIAEGIGVGNLCHMPADGVEAFAMPRLDARRIDAEKVASRPEAVHAVVEQAVKPAELERQQKQQVNADPKRQQRDSPDFNPTTFSLVHIHFI